jgi:hypothetical protein
MALVQGSRRNKSAQFVRTHRAECPCCKGKKMLKVWYPDEDKPRLDPCGHCEGTGEIEVEIEIS